MPVACLAYERSTFARSNHDQPQNLKNQSPIDLPESVEHVVSDMDDILINDLNKEFMGSIKNDGHTIKINFLNNDGPIIGPGGGLPRYQYKIDNIHFHWQSEHTINKKHFPLECHIVTYGSNYNDLNEALNKQGVSVFAVFYEYSENPGPEIEKILEIIPKIGKVDSTSNPFYIPNLVLGDFLPTKNLDNFYRYTGSLTTPPYTEGIVWTVFKETLGVSKNQMADLTDVYDERGKLILNNFRDVFPLEKRDLILADKNPENRNAIQKCLCGGQT